jgi:HD-GYP domain-containing protein (c-di-GMP phosphodiesterase class II)
VNVAIINGLMGKWLKMEEKEISNLVILGLIHDVGKTQISEEIINSPDTLTDEQLEIMKKHTQVSHDILKNNSNFTEEIRYAALHHHERMNGTGYPNALRMDDIPIYSRITAVSDVYDAMISLRSYKTAQSPFLVLKQLKEEQFWGLDIKLVNVFTEQMPKELVGKSVMMSNGMTGIVRHINDRIIEYPIVEIGGDIVTTNKDLYCVSMIIDG